MDGEQGVKFVGFVGRERGIDLVSLIHSSLQQLSVELCTHVATYHLKANPHLQLLEKVKQPLKVMWRPAGCIINSERDSIASLLPVAKNRQHWDRACPWRRS